MLKLSSQYLQLRIIAALFFGCASGIPLALIMSTLQSWLSIAGLTKTTIGLFTLTSFPYALKFLWSPLIDHFNIPFLGRKLGLRRSWLLVIQLLLSCSIIKLGFSNPLLNTYNFAMWAFIVSIFAATQDIILDAYRVEMLQGKQQGLGASATIFGHRVGFALSTGGTLLIVDSLCNKWNVCDNFMQWSIGYTISAIIIFVASVAAFIVGEPKMIKPAIKIDKYNPQGLIRALIVAPFIHFVKKNKWGLMLLFIVTYRMCDTFIAPMINPFFLDIGFTLTEVGLIVQSFGFFAITIGAAMGGVLTYRYGVTCSLFIGGLGQMFSNVMFIIQAKAGDNMTLLYLSIAAENIGGGMAAAGFIAYISSLCSNSKYTATQYALLTSLSAIDRVFAPILGGWVAEHLGWEILFGISVILGIPPLIMLYILNKIDNKINR